MSIHANSANDEVHTPIRFLYPNSTARLAATFSDFAALDAGKFAWQLDDNSVWMLADIGSGSSDPVWIPCNSEKAGSIVQVISTPYNPAADVSTSSNSYQSSGIAGSITPKYSNSKIFIEVFGGDVQNPVAGDYLHVTVKRNGSTDLTPSGCGALIAYPPNGGNGYFGPMSLGVEDSPGVDTSTTYEVYFKNENGVSAVYLLRSAAVTTPFVMKITEIRQ